MKSMCNYNIDLLVARVPMPRGTKVTMTPDGTTRWLRDWRQCRFLIVNMSAIPAVNSEITGQC